MLFLGKTSYLSTVCVCVCVCLCRPDCNLKALRLLYCLRECALGCVCVCVCVCVVLQRKIKRTRCRKVETYMAFCACCHLPHLPNCTSHTHTNTQRMFWLPDFFSFSFKFSNCVIAFHCFIFRSYWSQRTELGTCDSEIASGFWI